MRRLLRCKALWTPRGFVDDAVVEVDAKGQVAAVHARHEDKEVEVVDGYVIPGFVNAHSHAFQFAMAGVAENLPVTAAGDDFWSWREAMYALAGAMTPSRMQAVATLVYSEMLAHGFTSVIEFHYLHHDVGGKRYARVEEMSARLIAAAEAAGIALTLVPVLYRRGGFQKPASSRQERFLSASVEDYAGLVASVEGLARGKPDVNVGRGVHSLRAAEADEVKQVLAAAAAAPLHVHVAEQRAEVEECRKHWGKAPVEWLLDELKVDARLSLVHATHMTPAETERLAASKAVAVICPSTEGNLGDGFFALREYVKAGGAYAIGTDSHAGLSPFEELRWLDYGQRLRDEKRNPLCFEGGQDSGERLVLAAWRGGMTARGKRGKMAGDDAFALGMPFDAVVLDPEHAALLGKPRERWLSAAVFAGDRTMVKAVLRRGDTVVSRGVHRDGAAIRAGWLAAERP